MGKQERSERLQAQKKQAACRHTGARFRARRFTTCRQHAFCLCWRSTLPAMGLRPSCSPLALPRYRLSRGPLTCLSVLVAKQWYPVQISRRSRNQRVTNRTSSSTCRRRSPVVGVLQGACVMSGPSKKKGTTRRILTTAEPSFLDSFASRSKDVPSTTTLTWRFVTSPKRSICSHRTFPSASARGVTRTPFVGRPRVSATSISSQPRPAKTTHAGGDRTKAAEASVSQSSARPPWRSSPGKSSTTFDTGWRTCGGRDEVATKMQRVKNCALHQHTTDHLGPFVLDLSVIVDFAQHGIEMGNKFASRLWFTYSCMMSYAKTHPLRANASHTAVCLCDTPSLLRIHI